MRKPMLLGAVLASALAFPAVASAHTAKATIDCSAVTASYTSFAPNSRGRTNTVHYKVTVDGNSTADVRYVLDATGGSAGSITTSSAPADGRPHTVAFYTAWGTNGDTTTVDGHSGGSLTTALASATMTCGSPPDTPQAPPATPPAPQAPPATPPAPQPAQVTVPAAATFPSVTSPQAARQATCVSTPKVYRVRAGQTNTIVVRVRVGGKNIQGAKVRVTAPGVSQVKETASRGLVTFHIRPRRSGKLYIQSDQCLGADRVAVLGAKQSGTSTAPRFTG